MSNIDLSGLFAPLLTKVTEQVEGVKRGDALLTGAGVTPSHLGKTDEQAIVDALLNQTKVRLENLIDAVVNKYVPVAEQRNARLEIHKIVDGWRVKV